MSARSVSGSPARCRSLNKTVDRVCHEGGKGAELRDPPLSPSSRGRTTSIPTLTRPTRSPSTTNRLHEGGYLEIESDEGGRRRIRITRIHVEEDPGRLVHMGNVERGKYSLVDYNRAGIPLIEIVSEPDMRSPKEARKFLNKLRATLEYLSVFDSEKEGSLRVDANISIKGSERVEVKNITSYKGVEKALTFEITRQKEPAPPRAEG